jgi:transposase-like protein
MMLLYGLFEQLSELSAAQREALVAELASKGSANEIITLIETRFAAEPCCGHCQSERIGTWGHASGLRRRMCKDCGRTFNALTGTGFVPAVPGVPGRSRSLHRPGCDKSVGRSAGAE